MLVLSRADVDDDVQIQTSNGSLEGIGYRGHRFVIRQAYSRLQDAVLACRNDLDGGGLSIVVQDNNRFGVWSELPSRQPV